MLSSEQEDLIEGQQTRALRNIFGYGVSARRMRRRANIETLSERRMKACRKFANQLAQSPRFCHWFLKRPQAAHPRRDGVTYGEFIEYSARTQRCYNSPLFFYRRLLNERVWPIIFMKLTKIIADCWKILLLWCWLVVCFEVRPIR